MTDVKVAETTKVHNWAKYESEIIAKVQPQIAEQEAKLKSLVPRDPDGKPAKTDPRMLVVEEGFVRKVVRAALDPELEALLVESIVQRLVKPAPVATRAA